MARLEQRAPTAKVPHHKSDNATLAEGRGERVWSSWTIALLSFPPITSTESGQTLALPAIV